MPENGQNLLEQLNIVNRDRHNLRQIIPTLSLIVVLIVFWSLKLTGIGIAGEAFIGKSVAPAYSRQKETNIADQSP